MQARPPRRRCAPGPGGFPGFRGSAPGPESRGRCGSAPRWPVPGCRVGRRELVWGGGRRAAGEELPPPTPRPPDAPSGAPTWRRVRARGRRAVPLTGPRRLPAPRPRGRPVLGEAGESPCEPSGDAGALPAAAAPLPQAAPGRAPAGTPNFAPRPGRRRTSRELRAPCPRRAACRSARRPAARVRAEPAGRRGRGPGPGEAPRPAPAAPAPARAPPSGAGQRAPATRALGVSLPPGARDARPPATARTEPGLRGAARACSAPGRGPGDTPLPPGPGCEAGRAAAHQPGPALLPPGPVTAPWSSLVRASTWGEAGAAALRGGARTGRGRAPVTRGSVPASCDLGAGAPSPGSSEVSSESAAHPFGRGGDQNPYDVGWDGVWGRHEVRGQLWVPSSRLLRSLVLGLVIASALVVPFKPVDLPSVQPLARPPRLCLCPGPPSSWGLGRAGCFAHIGSWVPSF